jgi:hypothetical protein
MELVLAFSTLSSLYGSTLSDSILFVVQPLGASTRRR